MVPEHDLRGARGMPMLGEPVRKYQNISKQLIRNDL